MDAVSDKKAVVTGGAGFIGTHLCRALREAGYEVRVFDLGEPQKPVDGVQYVTGDIRNPEDLAHAFEGATVVFHMAALPRVQYSIENPLESNEANVVGALNVLLAARDAGVNRVVYSASSAAYGDQELMPLHEELLPQPKSPYGLQKYIGEHYARIFSHAYGLSTVSLRYFNVYGPDADPNGPYAQVIPRFILQRLSSEPMTITGDGEQTRDLVHVRDVARANILAAESDMVGKGEIINIGSSRSVSIKEIAQMIGGPHVHVEARLEPKHTSADISRARELLGWEPTISVEEGVAELKRIHGLG